MRTVAHISSFFIGILAAVSFIAIISTWFDWSSQIMLYALEIWTSFADALFGWFPIKISRNGQLAASNLMVMFGFVNYRNALLFRIRASKTEASPTKYIVKWFFLLTFIYVFIVLISLFLPMIAVFSLWSFYVAMETDRLFAITITFVVSLCAITDYIT